MPNFKRGDRPRRDDLDIASRVMDTVQKQIASYQNALQTLRAMREEIAQGYLRGAGSVPSTPDELAKLLEQRGIPVALSKAMAAEDFQDAAFQAEAAFWTWDCCCTDCCLTCVMASQVTGCNNTFVQ